MRSHRAASRASWGLLLSAWAASLGCGRTEAPLRLEGRWVMNRGRAQDELLVQADSFYIHSYTAPDQPAQVDTARWTVRRFQGELLVEFQNYRPRHRRESFPVPTESLGVQLQRAGDWAVTPERTLAGKLQLPVDDDLGWAYVQASGDSE